MGRTDEVQFILECVAEWRRLGARVTFEPGWESRGNGLQGNYEGGIVHHTASSSSAANPNPTRNTLINGRPDLTGPLCNVTGPWCADSDPWLHVIAAFPANHAGASGGKSMGPLPVTGLFNPRVLGLEVDYAGTTPMTGGQRKAALIFTRGLTNVLARSTEYVRAHAETSVTGKWDAGQAPGKTIDMAAFRRDAAAIKPGAVSALAASTEDDMKLINSPNRPGALIGPGFFRTLSQEQFDAEEAVWGKAKTLSDRWWDVVRNDVLSDQQGTGAQVVALTAAVGALAGGEGVTAEEIEAAVAKALQDNVVKVDVSIGDKTA